MNNIMTQKLLATLDAVTARDEVADDIIQKSAPRPGTDFDPDTGEWLGEKPEGYRPIPEPPSLKEIAPKETKAPDFEHSDATTDYKRVRDTTYALQEATLFMIGETAKLAVSTEAPRAFSVFRELIDTMRGLNKDLMDNQKTFKSVTQNEDPPSVDVSTDTEGNTSVTVKPARSSRDLLKMMELVKREAELKEAQRANKTEEIIDVDSEEVVEKEEVKDGNSEA